MALKIGHINLQTALEQESDKISKGKGAVLFRRGDTAYGMFIVISGKVSLDFGVDSCIARTYDRGALVGLPATLSGRKYSMTATVTEDAVLGFWSRNAFESLLRRQPQYYRELLDLLGERMAEDQRVARALADERPIEHVSLV